MFTYRSVLQIGGAALAVGAAALVPGSALAAPPTLAAFAVPDAPVADGYALQRTPTIAAAGDTVAWSQPSGDGEWELRVAVDGKLLSKVFEHAQWPVDVSLGTDARGRTVMLWSRCSARTTAKTRWRAYGCDLRRITSPTSSSVSRRVGGASTDDSSEFAPSRDGNRMVFVRRHYGSDLPRLYERDLSTGRERKLPIGPKEGSCSDACKDAGLIPNGAVESSVHGNHFATRWIDNANFGESFSDFVLRATHNGLTSGAGGPGLVSGTCTTRRYSSVQQVSLSITQSVIRNYSCEVEYGSPNSSWRVQRVTADGDVSTYADPQKRRIAAAVTTGDRLWMVRERVPVPPPTEGVTENPFACVARVGGCEVVAVDDPAFESVDRRP